MYKLYHKYPIFLKGGSDMNEAHNIANRIIEALNDPNRTVTVTALPMPVRAPLVPLDAPAAMPLMPMDATAAMPMIAQPAALPIRQTVTVQAPITNQAIEMYRNALIAQGLDNNEIDRRVSDIQRPARQAVIADAQARVVPPPPPVEAPSISRVQVEAPVQAQANDFGFLDNTPVVDYDDLPDFGL